MKLPWLSWLGITMHIVRMRPASNNVRQSYKTQNIRKLKAGRIIVTDVGYFLLLRAIEHGQAMQPMEPA